MWYLLLLEKLGSWDDLGVSFLWLRPPTDRVGTPVSTTAMCHYAQASLGARNLR